MEVKWLQWNPAATTVEVKKTVAYHPAGGGMKAYVYAPAENFLEGGGTYDFDF